MCIRDRVVDVTVTEQHDSLSNTYGMCLGLLQILYNCWDLFGAFVHISITFTLYTSLFPANVLVIFSLHWLNWLFVLTRFIVLHSKFLQHSHCQVLLQTLFGYLILSIVALWVHLLAKYLTNWFCKGEVGFGLYVWLLFKVICTTGYYWNSEKLHQIIEQQSTLSCLMGDNFIFTSLNVS